MKNQSKAMTNSPQPSATGEAAHTPTPWHVNLASVVSESGLHVSAITGYGMTAEQNAANRAFIVTACNSYESNQEFISDLKAELNECLREHEEPGGTRDRLKAEKEKSSANQARIRELESALEDCTRLLALLNAPGTNDPIESTVFKARAALAMANKNRENS